MGAGKWGGGRIRVSGLGPVYGILNGNEAPKLWPTLSRVQEAFITFEVKSNPKPFTEKVYLETLNP